MATRRSRKKKETPATVVEEATDVEEPTEPEELPQAKVRAPSAPAPKKEVQIRVRSLVTEPVRYGSWRANLTKGKYVIVPSEEIGDWLFRTGRIS